MYRAQSVYFGFQGVLNVVVGDEIDLLSNVFRHIAASNKRSAQGSSEPREVAKVGQWHIFERQQYNLLGILMTPFCCGY